jgi:hypothetical protein
LDLICIYLRSSAAQIFLQEAKAPTLQRVEALEKKILAGLKGRVNTEEVESVSTNRCC